MGLFSRGNNAQQRNSLFSRGDNAEQRNSLLLSWNISAAATIILPLFMFMISRLVNRGEGGGGEEKSWWWWGGNNNEEGGGEGRSWWWFGNDDQPDEERGAGALIFVYVWSLLLFAVVVWYGNKALEKQKEKHLRALFAALVVFANLGFLCSILIGSLFVQGEGEEAEEQGWLGQFPAIVVLTFVFWIIFAFVFATILFQKQHKAKSSRNSDYQRQDDGGVV